MRVNTVDALGEIGGRDAARYLEQMLGDENDVVRDAAAEWLVALRGAAASDAYVRTDVSHVAR